MILTSELLLLYSEVVACKLQNIYALKKEEKKKELDFGKK